MTDLQRLLTSKYAILINIYRHILLPFPCERVSKTSLIFESEKVRNRYAKASTIILRLLNISNKSSVYWSSGFYLPSPMHVARSIAIVSHDLHSNFRGGFQKTHVS